MTTDHYVIARERNVVRVDFRREPTGSQFCPLEPGRERGVVWYDTVRHQVRTRALRPLGTASPRHRSGKRRKIRHA